MSAARAAAEGAVRGLAAASRRVASNQARVRGATQRPQRSRRVQNRLADQGETYRKLQQVLSSRVTRPPARTPARRSTDPRLARELADAQRQAPKGRYVSPTSRAYTRVVPRPAPRQPTRTPQRAMPPTGRARAQVSAIRNPDPQVTQRIAQQANQVYQNMRDTYRSPEYQDLASRGFFDINRRALAEQESNESMRFSSIIDDAQRRIRDEAFRYGASPAELYDAQTVFDGPRDPVTGALIPRYARSVGTRIGQLPEVGQLPPSVLASLRAAEAGLPEQLRIAQEVMASFGYDPGLVTDADMLAYMNQIGVNMRDQEKLISERDYMARTGGAYRDPGDEIDALLAPGEKMDAERAAQDYARYGFDSPQAMRSYIQAQREAEALQSGEFTYEGVPYESEGDMQIAARRDVEFNEDMDVRALVDEVNRYPEYSINRQQLSEFAKATETSEQAVAQLMVSTPYRSVLESARRYFSEQAQRDEKSFSRWVDQDAEEMFSSPEDAQFADMATRLDESPYAEVWRGMVRHQVLGGS